MVGCWTAKDLPEDVGLGVLGELNSPLGLAAVALAVEGRHIWFMLLGSGGSCALLLLFSDVIMPSQGCRIGGLGR